MKGLTVQGFLIGFIVVMIIGMIILGAVNVSKKKLTSGGEYALSCERLAGLGFAVDAAGGICVAKLCDNEESQLVVGLSAQCPSKIIFNNEDDAGDPTVYDTCCLVNTCEQANLFGGKKRVNQTIDADNADKCVGYAKDCNLKTTEGKDEKPKPCCCVFEK